MPTGKTRCPWATTPLGIEYHDREWGVPLHDDVRLFEFLILEGAQAGLSWETILRKRIAYRKAFAGFDPRKVAKFTPTKIASLLQDPGIVRNRLKIESAVANARGVLKIQKEFGSLDAYLWQFVGHKPIVHRFSSMKQLQAQSPQSQAMSKDLRRRGFNFVGPTICYALMQAVGMVDDHLRGCYRASRVAGSVAGSVVGSVAGRGRAKRR